jgi:hypothetical protein
MHHDDSFEPELEALRALPRVTDPGQVLEERTVQALRQRGLLQAPQSRTPLGRWAWAAAAVLVLAVFSAGFLIGRSGATPGAPARDSVSRESKPARDAGVAKEKPHGRDVTVANDTQQQSQTNASERYVVWF